MNFASLSGSGLLWDHFWPLLRLSWPLLAALGPLLAALGPLLAALGPLFGCVDSCVHVSWVCGLVLGRSLGVRVHVSGVCAHALQAQNALRPGACACLRGFSYRARA